MGEDGAGPSTVTAPPPPMHLPVVTAAGDVTQMIALQQPAGPPTPPALQGRPWDGPGMSDDASVLPVPSHVVLHHLSTSAIRNGVLAVANTTRYKKKVRTCVECVISSLELATDTVSAVYYYYLLQAHMTPLSASSHMRLCCPSSYTTRHHPCGCPIDSASPLLQALGSLFLAVLCIDVPP